MRRDSHPPPFFFFPKPKPPAISQDSLSALGWRSGFRMARSSLLSSRARDLRGGVVSRENGWQGGLRDGGSPAESLFVRLPLRAIPSSVMVLHGDEPCRLVYMNDRMLRELGFEVSGERGGGPRGPACRPLSIRTTWRLFANACLLRQELAGRGGAAVGFAERTAATCGTR